MNKRNFGVLAAGITLLVAGMLAGCGNNAEAPADTTAAPGATTTAPAGGGDKTAPPAGGKMPPPGPAAK